jgi:hypothetical protein
LLTARKTERSAQLSRNAQFDPRLLRKGINAFLEDVYGHPHYLRVILRDGGMTEPEIAQLRQTSLIGFLLALTQQWYPWLRNVLTDVQCEALVRSYSLDGNPASTIEELAVDLGTSSKRTRHLLRDTLTRLHSRSPIQETEAVTATVASQVLHDKR